VRAVVHARGSRYNTRMDLAHRRCAPCSGATPKLEGAELEAFRKQLPTWKIVDGKLRKRFELKDFRHAMFFLNEVAAIAEHDDHHPYFTVEYSKVDFTIWTHAIDGLSENDFVLAAKIDAAAE
jgi:4a-hydroxytetrahydrobiopterin dehydratase